MHPFDVKSKGERGLWLYLPLGAAKTAAQRQTLCPLSSPGSSCRSGDRAVFPKLTLLGMLRRKNLSRGPRGLRGNGSWAMGSLSTSFVVQTAASHGCDVFNKCLHFLSYFYRGYFWVLVWCLKVRALVGPSQLMGASEVLGNIAGPLLILQVLA